MDSRYKRLGKNTVLVFIGKAGSSIISILMLPFYTHWLLANEYGTTDLINTYSAILMGFVSLCIADAIFVFPKDADKQGRTRYYTSGYYFAAGMTIIFVLLFALVDYLKLLFNWKGILFEYSWFILAFAICQFLQQYSQSFLRSTDKMKVYSITGVVLTGSQALLSFFLLPRYGLNGYLYAIIISNVLSFAFTLIASRSYEYLSLKSFKKESLIELLKYGLPLLPNGMMWWIVNSVNRPIMESNLGLDAVGIYAVASKFPSMLSILVGVFGTAWSISMIEEFGKPDFNRFFNRTMKLLFFVAIVGCCLIAAFSKIIIMVFADSAYFDAWRYIPVLTLGIVLQLQASNVGGVFMAEKKSKYFFYSSIWGAIATLIVTFPLIKIWGLQGAAIAVAVSCLVMAITRTWYAWNYINEMPLLWYFASVLLSIVFIIVVLLDMPLYVSIPLYIIIVVILFGISKDVLVPAWETLKGFINR